MGKKPIFGRLLQRFGKDAVEPTIDANEDGEPVIGMDPEGKVNMADIAENLSTLHCSNVWCNLFRFRNQS